MRVELAAESNKTMKSCWKSYVLCVFAAAVFQPIVAESEGMLRCTSTSFRYPNGDYYNYCSIYWGEPERDPPKHDNIARASVRASDHLP